MFGFDISITLPWGDFGIYISPFEWTWCVLRDESSYWRSIGPITFYWQGD